MKSLIRLWCALIIGVVFLVGAPEAQADGFATRSNIVNIANAQLGKPYSMDLDKRLGPYYFDCSGLVLYCYRNSGVTINNSLCDWIAYPINPAEAMPGDLVYMGYEVSPYYEFPTGYHIGIYVGDGWVIEAKGTAWGVVKTRVEERGWTWYGRVPAYNWPGGDNSIAYAGTYSSVNVPASMTRGRTFSGSLKLTNAGTATWRTGGANPVHLSYHWKDENGNVVVRDGARTNLPYDVGPGGTVDITNMNILAPDTLGYYTLSIDAVVEGITWLSTCWSKTYDVTVGVLSGGPLDGLITVPTAGPGAMYCGSTVSSDIQLTNFGTAVWPAGGANPVHLSYHWVNATTGEETVREGIRSLLPHDVAPNQTVTVDATIKAPPSPGEFILKLDIVQEAVEWFSNLGVPTKNTHITVCIDTKVRFDSVSTPTLMYANNSYSGSVTLTNTSKMTWVPTGPNPVRLSYHWVNAVTGQMAEFEGERTSLPTEIGPGEQIVLSNVPIKAPPNPGNYILKFDMVQEGITWFSWTGAATSDKAITVPNWYNAGYSVTSPPPSSMYADATAPVTINLTNTGSLTWPSSGANPVRLSYHWVNANTGAMTVFDGPRAVLLNPVTPGGSATITDFSVKAPPNPGNYILKFDMVQEGITWFSWTGAATSDKAITIPNWYNAGYSVTSPPPSSMYADATAPVTINLTNTGSLTWPSSGANPVRLSYHWVNANTGAMTVFDGPRAVLLNPVTPGGSATITAFSVKAPPNPGNYILKFDMVQEGITWFSWTGAATSDKAITVPNWYNAGYSVTSPPPSSMYADATAPVTINLTNTGSLTWPSSGANPVRLSYHWVNANTGAMTVFDGPRAVLLNPVTPGGSATITDFSVKAPPNPGNYILKFDMVQEGITWFSWTGAATSDIPLEVK